MSISTRIFLAMLGTLALVVAIMGFATRWSFERGFLGYLNGQAEARLHEVLPRVQQAYADNGSWDFLRSNRGAWFGLMRPANVPDWPGADGSDLPAPTTSDLTGAVIRLGLLDAQEQFVAGYRQVNEQLPKQAVVVNGETVGWLVLAPFEEAADDADHRFQKGQTRATLAVGMLSLALAAGIAWRLSRRLSRPVKELAGATHRLAAGHLDARVDLDRHDEIGVLADDFNRMAEALGRSQALRQEFLADVSHELRTPLSVLRGEIEALQDGVRPLSLDAVSSLQAEVMQLEKLVADLNELALSDVGALSYRMEPLDLAEVVRQVALSHQVAMQRLGLDLELDLPPEPVMAQGDATRLRQLLDNLLTNCARYTDAPGRVVVSVRQNEDKACMTVMDSAPTAPAADLARLFDRFFRLDASRSRETGGAGLGLAIVRNIVQAHGGQIEARQSELGGVEMTMRLPLATPMDAIEGER
ncbi:ATP-binding protein [Hydrogenophaga sp. 5NK40-0174]|uniref:ATP-binding protein n=1 Tax=Hydrogenophaga sp. 5NK40-0174 TaxID=3127649 RepID=UPI00333F4974